MNTDLTLWAVILCTEYTPCGPEKQYVTLLKVTILTPLLFLTYYNFIRCFLYFY